MKILVVDQSPIYRDILLQALEGYGDVCIELATTAADAQLLVTEQRFSFFIISGQLPDGDGIALVRSLRLSRSLTLEPMVILTSSPSASMNHEAESSGVTEIFRKSDIAELAIFLRRFLAVFSPLQGRVLYVEDAADQRLMLVSQLRSWGLQVDACANAETAWEAYQSTDYDLLIADLVLGGGMSGARLVNRIRRQPGVRGDLPILAVTAFDSPTRRTSLFHLGVNDYVSKPIVGIEMRARVQHLLAQRRDELHCQAVEERLTRFAAHLPAVLRVVARDRSRILYVSPAYETIWQRSSLELCKSASSWAWFDAVHPEDRQQVLDVAMSEPETGAYQTEYRIIRPDGQIRRIRDQAFPLQTLWEGVPCTAGIAEDITDTAHG